MGRLHRGSTIASEIRPSITKIGLYALLFHWILFETTYFTDDSDSFSVGRTISTI